MQTNGRLIVVSNRVNIASHGGDESIGGLATAVGATLGARPSFWFGWSGCVVNKSSGQMAIKKFRGVETATIDLEAIDVEQYYDGHANSTLWPLFHHRPDLAIHDESFRQGYERVNRLFANALSRIIHAEDTIWIHDYHLIPLGRELRRMGISNRLGFFLHTPWPVRSVFTTLPDHQDLAHALFEYDLLGFQTEEYLRAFREYAAEELQAKSIRPGLLQCSDRLLGVGCFPVGIDGAGFAKIATRRTARVTRREMLSLAGTRSLIVGADRLDYSKGILERLHGFEHFLATNPTLRQNVLMLQIAPVSRDAVGAYRAARKQVDCEAARINEKYADSRSAPLNYTNTRFRRDELAGVFSAARVGLVTPLRDGMNLVAKEFVAAQDPADPGVLVLSKFAGAAAQLRDALLIDPRSREEVSEGLRCALSLERTERVRRWELLFDAVQRESAESWHDSFLRALAETG